MNLFRRASVAYTVWHMPDDSVRVVKVRQRAYEKFALADGAVGDAPGRPSDKAIFILGADGLFESEEFTWSYNFSQAREPQNGFSITEERAYTPEGVRKRLRLTPNHRSVTFDAASSGTAANANSLTISHTVTAAQSNLYICGMVIVHTNTLSSSSYNSVAMTTRDSNTGTNYRPYLTDLVNPSTGTHNGVFTPNSKSDMAGGFVSLYGVDQTTPRRSTGNANATNTAPTLTLSSGANDVAVSNVGWDGSAATDTVDTFWVSRWSLTGANNTRSEGMTITGASPTQVRTDTLNNSTAWAIVGASIQPPAAAGGVSQLAALGVG